MKSRWTLLFSVLVVAALILSACSNATATQEAQPTTAPVVEEEPTATTAPTAVVEQPAVTEVAATEVTKTACPLQVEEGAKITFSGWGDEAEQQIYKDSITRFQEVCPGVTVEYLPVPDSYQDKMKAQMAAGTAPDVMYIDDQLMTAFASSGQLLDLSPYMSEAGVSKDDFITVLFKIFEQNGKIFALPKDWGTLGLVYIPKYFEEAGIAEPTSDWTWDDLRTAAKAISDKGTVPGFCMGADWARFAPFVFSNGGSYASADYTTATLNTPAVIEMATLVSDMYKEKSLVNPADISASWCGEAIGKELVAMTLEGGWMVNTMNTTYPDIKWVAVEIPNGPVTRSDVIFTNGIGISAATQYPKAAAAFTIFVTGYDNQAAIVSTGFAYSTHPSQADLITDQNWKALAEGGLLPDAQVAYWGPYTSKVNDTVSQALSRIFLGDQTVEEAFAQAQEEAQAALSGE